MGQSRTTLPHPSVDVPISTFTPLLTIARLLHILLEIKSKSKNLTAQEAAPPDDLPFIQLTRHELAMFFHH